MSGTNPPYGSGPSGPQPPYGQPSGNEPPPAYGSQPGQPTQPGQGGYGQPPGSGGFGNPSSGSSAPTYFGPGSTPPQQQGPPTQPMGQQPGPYGQPQPTPYGQPSANPMGPVGPGGPGGPGPYGATPPPAKKKGNGLLIGVIGGAVALIVIIAIVLGVALNRNTPIAGGDPTGGGSGSSAPAKAKNQSDAVKGFLEALAAGNSANALAYANTEPSDKTYLTDAVLAASNKVAPITAINVPEVGNEYSTYVSATYSLGATKVTEDFQVVKAGDEWKLDTVAKDVDVSSIRFDGLPLKINGIDVTEDTVVLFPGSYTVTTGVANISYGKGVLILKSPDDYAGTSDLTPVMTAAGKTAFKTAVKAAITACVAKKSLTPGCGLVVVPTGGKITASTITWKITRNPNLSDFDPRLDYSDPRIGKGYSSVSVSFRGTGKRDDGSPGIIETTKSISSYSADLTKSKITVVFED